MVKFILSGWLVIAYCWSAGAQMSQSIKYRDHISTAISIQRDLSYGAPGKRSALFDLYEPSHDSTARRPLIIWMHGGGFKFGTKEAKGIRLWCSDFARRGYVCAAINYRLGKKDLRFGFNDLVRNCRAGVQDAREAIRFFRNNAAALRIDTGRIILAGNSAGGMIALQTVYSTDAELLRLAGDSTAQTSGAGEGTEAREDGHVAAIINFWGGIFDTGWLENARVPIVSVHGKRDRIVPYEHKGYPLYGSLIIHEKADSLHIPNRLKTYEDYSHELQKHFNPVIVSRATKKRWLEAGQFAADFLYQELFAGSRKDHAM